jgi:hypothetical protein
VFTWAFKDIVVVENPDGLAAGALFAIAQTIIAVTPIRRIFLINFPLLLPIGLVPKGQCPRRKPGGFLTTGMLLI